MKKLKMSKKAWWITGIVLLVVILTVWLISRAKNIKQSNTTSGTTDENNESNTNTSVFPLQYGSRGVEVENLQQWLQQQGQALPQYGIDGIFMNETKSALTEVTGSSKVTASDYTKMMNGTYVIDNNTDEPYNPTLDPGHGPM